MENQPTYLNPDIWFPYRLRNAVNQELGRQYLKFGDQSDKTPEQWISILTEEVGELARTVNDRYMGKVEMTETVISQEAIQCIAVITRLIYRVDSSYQMWRE